MDLSRKSAQTTLNEFLRISAAEAGKLAPRKHKVDLQDLLDEVQDAASLQAKEKPVDLHLQLEPNTPGIWLDRSHIGQAISTLLSIAMEYADPNTAVTVSVRRVMSLVVFSVMHRGQGIWEEELFSQGLNAEFRPRLADTHNALLSRLASVRDVVQAHHGHIWIEVDAGEATTFSFILPVND